ncbi:hypothetical protein ACTHQ6_00720 [Arthrobacter sp. SAFR-179]
MIITGLDEVEANNTAIKNIKRTSRGYPQCCQLQVRYSLLELPHRRRA